MSDWKSVWQEKTRGGGKVWAVFDLPTPLVCGETVAALVEFAGEKRLEAYQPSGSWSRNSGDHQGIDLLPVPRPPKMRPMTHREMVEIAAERPLYMSNRGTVFSSLSMHSEQDGSYYQDTVYSLDAGETWNRFEVPK